MTSSKCDCVIHPHTLIDFKDEEPCCFMFSHAFIYKFMAVLWFNELNKSQNNNKNALLFEFRYSALCSSNK